MAAREIARKSVVCSLLELSDDIQVNYDATANRTNITEAGKILLSITDYLLYARTTVECHQGERAKKSYQASRLTRFRDVVDIVLEWLEHSGQANTRKQEQVLRGLYNLTGT